MGKNEIITKYKAPRSAAVQSTAGKIKRWSTYKI